MLIANKRKIRLSQLIYVFLILSFSILALIPITIQFNAILLQDESFPPNYYGDPSRELATDFSGIETVFLDNPLLIVLPLRFVSLTVIFYIPTQNSLGLTKLKGRRNFRIAKSRLPEFGYTIPLNGIQFRIKRKLTSLKGLFLRELDLLIILPKEYKGDKRLFDFLACEHVYHTPNQIILRKTVDIQNIPLLLVRTKALLTASN